MKRLLVLSWMILTASLVGQVKHAPTLAQCQADQRLWLADMDSSKRLTYEVLTRREREMLECEKVDDPNLDLYYNTAVDMDEEALLRLVHFLDRHQLLGKFREEDAAGKR